MQTTAKVFGKADRNLIGLLMKLMFCCLLNNLSTFPENMSVEDGKFVQPYNASAAIIELIDLHD